MDRLPPDQREALRLRVLDERDYAEIARELECSEAVVRQRVSRATRTLRAMREGDAMTLHRLLRDAARRGRPPPPRLAPAPPHRRRSCARRRGPRRSSLAALLVGVPATAATVGWNPFDDPGRDPRFAAPTAVGDAPVVPS